MWLKRVHGSVSKPALNTTTETNVRANAMSITTKQYKIVTGKRLNKIIVQFCFVRVNSAGRTIDAGVVLFVLQIHCTCKEPHGEASVLINQNFI